VFRYGCLCTWAITSIIIITIIMSASNAATMQQAYAAIM
jgi:hypothetical protein